MNKIIKNYYPNILVTLQFGIIAIMLLSTHHFFSSFYPTITFIIGATLGVRALNDNQLGNFNIQPKLKKNAHLITTGIYSYIRHPMYLSVTIMMLSTLIASPTLLKLFLFIALITTLWLKAKREESLWEEHDENYKRYKRKSWFFLPLIL